MWTLVTGGSKRLGRAICLAFAAEGRDVVIHYNTSYQEALDTQRECRLLGVQAEIAQGDFSSKESVEAFIEAYRARFLNTVCLVNNVGNYLVKPVVQTEYSEWCEMFMSNVHVPFLLSKALLPGLSSIVNIGVAGLYRCKADAYVLAKEALLGLTKALARECVGVSVNMVSPGYMDNSVNLPKNLPMKRPATPEEVAAAVVFFADQKNCYITGQNLEVAGGVRL